MTVVDAFKAVYLSLEALMLAHPLPEKSVRQGDFRLVKTFCIRNGWITEDSDGLLDITEAGREVHRRVSERLKLGA